MLSAGPHYEIIYSHEVLRAKHAIRDHYFKTIAKEIYENAGQLLSLVRVQLASIQKLEKEDFDKISHSGDIIGKVIRNLREMSKNFYPEVNILTEAGLSNALKQELLMDQQADHNMLLRIKGISTALPDDSGLIFFHVVLEILSCLQSAAGKKLLKIEIVYSRKKIAVNFIYTGEKIKFDPARKNKDLHLSSHHKLTIKERMKLIGGNILIEPGKTKKKKLVISLPL